MRMAEHGQGGEGRSSTRRHGRGERAERIIHPFVIIVIQLGEQRFKLAIEVALSSLPEPCTLAARRRYLRREHRCSRILLTVVIFRRRRWRSSLRRLHTSLNGDGRLPQALQTPDALDALDRHRGGASKQE